MVNAYVLYVKHNTMMGRKKKDLLSSYDFRTQIAYAWIAPSTQDPRFASKDKREAKRKRKSTSPSQSVGSNSSQSAKLPPRKSPRMSLADDIVTATHRLTDSSLAVGGSLSMVRLRTDLTHRAFPERKPKSKCQLHRWASGCLYRARILWCPDCQVHLCDHCFSIFHDVDDLIENKDKLGSLFREQKATKETKGKVGNLLASVTQREGV